MSYFFFASALYFFCAAICNVFVAFHSIGPFTKKGVVKAFGGHNLGVSEFIDDFNEYLESVNWSNKLINLITAGVNIFAGVAAFIAALTT